MSALRRVARAPGLIVLLVTLHLFVAALLGSGVRSAVGRSMRSYSMLTDGHLLGAVLELLGAHPGLLANFRLTLVGSSMIALVLSTLLAPAVILWLRTPNPASRIAGAAWRGVPAVVVTTLWHLLPRAVLLAAAGMATAKVMDTGAWGLAGVVATAAVLAYCTCALDLARCRVMLRGARRFHFSTAGRAYLEALRRPAVLLPSMVLSFARWSCVTAMLVLAINHGGAGPTIWLVRALAILGIVCGLTRVAVAVEAQ